MSEGVAPAIAGPAGATFEGQVAAFYLLSLLANSEARGLPGAKINRVGLQKAPEGLELDDVVVCATHDDGTSAVLEIQVKRSIRFTSGDSVWKKVVGQIVAAALKPGFWETRHELAIAITKTTAKIDGPYQDVLMWARNLGSANAFFHRLRMKGVASDGMRDFVHALRFFLGEHHYPNNDEATWKLLKRLQILVFDFSANGGICEELARDRASRLVDATAGGDGEQLWKSLIVSSLTIASQGGDRNRVELVGELNQRFKFEPARDIRRPFERLSEAASSGLSDIDETIGQASLARSQYLAKTREHLDTGRYVEIRGESGTGKSAILKKLAELVSFEARIIYLNPYRTVPGGWIALQRVLQTNMSLKEFLSELGINGGAIVFIDNLDFFSESAQATVRDIIRHAASVPGISVVVTCRKSFGTDVPSWIPESAIRSLGGARVVEVGELVEEEFDELSLLEPGLAPLLNISNPARPVAANLFRLSRLAGALGSDIPSTEAAMSSNWWASADNISQQLRREGKRLLRVMAERLLSNNQPLDARQFSPDVIDELIKSGTLKEFGADELTFRHDVLRDWALANLLHNQPENILVLPLGTPLPSSMERAVDILARLSIEGAESDEQYFGLVNRFSGPSVHGSWRRPLLLALVRSEASDAMLDSCRAKLISDDANILIELIRTLRAVEVQSAQRFFSKLGIDVSSISDGVKLPMGPAWPRLIRWLLNQPDEDLSSALQDVVDLYSTWCVATLGAGPEGLQIIEKFNRWLVATELSRHGGFSTRKPRREPPFPGALHREALLRRCFLQFAKEPAAKRYLDHVTSIRNNDDIAREIIRYSGSLTKTAPAELVSLMLTSLVPSKEDDEDRERFSPLTFVDDAFMPAGPSQGPFLQLLVHSPQNGLSAIRQLIDHIVLFKTDGRDPGTNSITISLFGKERRFVWRETFLWSHGDFDTFAAASALMALEAWGHKRIESGEAIEGVLADVVGSGDRPMCYLAVAIDLIMSHWDAPTPLSAAFIGNPELLVLDRDRQIFDAVGGGRSIDIGGPFPEPPAVPGFDTIENLRSRPSRKCTLLQCLYGTALSEDEVARDIVRSQLTASLQRLGPFGKDADLRDPEFMAAHAMNALNRSNWRSQETAEGRMLVYIAPENERFHLEAMSSHAQKIAQKSNIEVALFQAAENPKRSSPELARAGVAWAKQQQQDGPPLDQTEAWAWKLTITRAALVAVRDGDDALKEAEWSWAVDIFRTNYEIDLEDRLSQPRLIYSHTGMAFCGLSLAMAVQRWEGDIDLLLQLAQSHSTAPAEAFDSVIGRLAAINPKLPKSVLRTALMAQVHPRLRTYEDEEGSSDRKAEYAQKRQRCVELEKLWLLGEKGEPKWPSFPDPVISKNSRIIRLPMLGGSGDGDSKVKEKLPRPPEEYVDSHGAAKWLKHFAIKFESKDNPWVIDLLRHFRGWVLKINGVGLTEATEVKDPLEWNAPYFLLLLRAFLGLAQDELREWLDPILNATPDDNFCRAARDILFAVDEIYFGDRDDLNAEAVLIRSSIADRLLKTRLWRSRSRERELSIDMELGSAVSALFFSVYVLGARSFCYLTPTGMDRVEPFIPTLRRLILEGSFGFVPISALNFLEVRPDEKYLAFTAECLSTWLDHFGENREFWVDVGIGPRICTLISKMRKQTLASDFDGEIARLLPRLVKLGVTEAKDLEEYLASPSTT